MNTNENGVVKKQKFRKLIYTAVVIVLVVGLAFGSLFGSAVDVFAWFGNSESENVPQIGSFEEIRPFLEQELKQRKEHEILMQHMDALVMASNVEINLALMETDDINVVVAMVNGEEITKGDLLALEENEKQQLRMMGLDPASEEVAQLLEEMRPQILDKLISNAVLLQKIEEEGIAANEALVEERYQQYAAQYGGVEMLEQQLEQAGLTKDELKQEISEQLPIQIYAENYLVKNQDKIKFSEAELRDLYEVHRQRTES